MPLTALALAFALAVALPLARAGGRRRRGRRRRRGGRRRRRGRLGGDLDPHAPTGLERPLQQPVGVLRGDLAAIARRPHVATERDEGAPHAGGVLRAGGL